MEKCDEVWIFVEEKLGTSVPRYIKNILQICGFNNAVTISAIEGEDIEYFENEVRKGNISRFYNDKKNALEGCVMNEENFEFSRGHKTLLILIVDFLKKYLEENGLDSCILDVEPQQLPIKRKTTSSTVSRKRFKYAANPNVNATNELISDGVRAIKNTLLTKVIMSLIRHTPEMYVKTLVKDIEMVGTKMSTDLITVNIKNFPTETLTDENTEVDEVITYNGTVTCPFCAVVLPLSQSTRKYSSGCSSSPWWNISNFDRHLTRDHNYLDSESDGHIENLDIRNKNGEHKQPSDGMRSKEQTKEFHGSMLQNFVNSAERNSSRSKPGYRYDIITKMFAAFIKLIAGLLAYETMHANFPFSLPSVSTVNRFCADNGPQIIEGEMRTGELLECLKSRKLPLQVSLSEDATRITSKISYDPKTNQLIGFNLPLDMNGMPIKCSFPAKNAREIQGHFTNPSNSISTTAYVQMAQPIEPNASPFCLMIHSTDNKFTANDVFKRWKFQACELKQNGINVNNISTDGDSRTLMAMKVLSRIGQSDRSYLDSEWFSCGGNVETTFTQDTEHIITKGRNRILKCSRIFPIGNKIISSSHLKYLIQHVSKDKHLLTKSDIEPNDRQNFLSADKICSERVIECLLEYVPGSEGTALYLKVMRSVLDAFLNTEIESEDRIYLIWYAVFFCRAWRSWILNSEKSKTSVQKRQKSFYNLKENFISSNCYTCIELNAHALIKQVLADNSDETSIEDQDEQIPCGKFFFRNLFGSQVCESMFRQIRSFTSTFSTVVNFNMLDIIHRIRKIQLLNDIINICNGEIKFPRFEKKDANISAVLSQGRHRLNSLNRLTIISQIENAKQAVINDLERLRIDTSNLNFHCQIKPVLEEDLEKQMTEIDCDIDSDDEEVNLTNEHLKAEFLDDEPEYELQNDINFLSGITGRLDLKNYDSKEDEEGNIDEESPFAFVADNSGYEQVVRKSALVYVLTKDKHRLSSDRLQRVQEKEYAMSNSTSRSVPSVDHFIVNDEIHIGDWCIFYTEDNEEEDDEKFPFILALVLGFTYLKGNTFKEREFSKSFASVQSNSEKEVGVLCNFYDFNDFGILTSLDRDKHKFIKIELYMGTIKEPIYTKKTLNISKQLISELYKLNGC